ncbi:MAG: PadR family transcriptional regulator [Candidatus Bathyarchaeota archaeon B24]|nr:MAG: PadR family transcriptional regulator [Candidatus Bathyarchaeota archaeon B24]
MAYNRLTRKLTVENLWMYILKMLSEKPMYAYEIKRALKERFGFTVATITVYMVLYKMTREGLVEKVPVEGDSRRQYYKSTKRGLDTLREGLKFLEKTLKTLSLP